MESSLGFMAVFAVSGSVVFVARQIHKRLLSEFMKKIEFELRSEKCLAAVTKKKVRFAEDVVEPSANNEEYRRRRAKGKIGNQILMRQEENLKMPLNRQVLYKGIVEYKTLHGLSYL